LLHLAPSPDRTPVRKRVRVSCTSLTAVVERVEKWDNSRFVYHDLDVYELPFGPRTDESDEGWPYTARLAKGEQLREQGGSSVEIQCRNLRWHFTSRDPVSGLAAADLRYLPSPRRLLVT
jgi:hypothetical protein